ncbi:DUF4260 domain-containing protein [Roseibium sp. M-1]
MTGENSLVIWQKVEALFVFLAALVLYFWTGASWLVFLVLFLVPDLSMLGYLANPRIGALVYNLFHTYTGPALLIALGVILTDFGYDSYAFWDFAPIAIIWTAHIAFDRVLGYGLKSPQGFKITHLGRIGRQETEK